MKIARRGLALVMALLFALSAAVAFAAETNAVKTVKINKSTFPDPKFREFVKSEFDNNNDGRLSATEINKATNMNAKYKGIANLKGVEVFVNLEYLECDCNELTKLDVSKNKKLLVLSCSENKLTKLDVSKNKKLKLLRCDENKLKTLNLTKNTALEELTCHNNNLTKLTLGTHKKLRLLVSSKNNLKTVDIKGCPKIRAIIKKSNRSEDLVNGQTVAIWWIAPDNPTNCVRIDPTTKLMNGTKVLYKP